MKMEMKMEMEMTSEKKGSEVDRRVLRREWLSWCCRSYLVWRSSLTFRPFEGKLRGGGGHSTRYRADPESGVLAETRAELTKPEATRWGPEDVRPPSLLMCSAEGELARAGEGESGRVRAVCGRELGAG